MNIHTAKINFSKLVDAVSHGEEVIIAKAEKLTAKLLPIEAVKPQRKAGSLKGKIKIAVDFDAPLPDDIINQFESK
ncbi:type II toxin-antitoxin system Phd/YefM family antitoxin [Coxiella endosymbiont of Ornithodoros maritimus]|uniref:type II toxin-antitoxin system Phd/YefM family antitoxin n=1 Tax=Coxiella endosymbiont of Ornithodoros maritimus TaxID=1656172 RepID=UPI002264607F|nr:type II toxin-antitoxin system Phd/YefM family antitoxin [Coxiella endosymbiont of Ornithodoros maritimus]